MKRILFPMFLLLLVLAGFAQAQAFPQKSMYCSACHQSQNLGKEGYPKKLALPDANAPINYTKENVLRSMKGETGPHLDGLDTDPQWATAPALKVKTYWLSPKGPKEGSKGEPEVTLKSFYTQDKLYLLARWADPRPDLQKELWEFKGGKWVQDKTIYDEDRLAIQWDNNVAGFDRVGCAITCHGYIKDYGKYTNNPGERVDLWHWKSTRTKPLNWTDDGSVIYVSPEEIGKTKGRLADSGKSGEVKNEQTIELEGTKVKIPKYAFDPAQNTVDPNVLLASQAVPLGPGPFAEGEKVPGFVITDNNLLGLEPGPTGSRGDVQTVARWEKGYWTLEMARSLNTNQPDDTVFVPGQKKAFGIAVYDNNTEYNHAVSGVLYLDLVKEQKVSQTIGAKKTGIVLAKGLNFRQAPSVKGKKVGILKKGTSVTVLKKQGNWLLVQTKWGQGYVYGKWIKIKG